MEGVRLTAAETEVCFIYKTSSEWAAHPTPTAALLICLILNLEGPHQMVI